MSQHPTPADLGEPDLKVAGFQLWVHGRQFPEAADYDDGNWLRVTAHCGASGAGVWAQGAIVMVTDIAGFGRECEAPAPRRLEFSAHGPLHAPPDDLHTFDLSGPPEDTPIEHQKAMIEALDTEIGRLFASIEPEVLGRTTVIFLADNGTPGDRTEPPFVPAHGKATVYEGGINVPLIVSGPRVAHPGSECEALVNTTDLFATVVEIAAPGALNALPRGTRLDSVSLLPYLEEPALPSLRSWVYAEKFAPNGYGPYDVYHQAIRGERYKLIRRIELGTESLYDLLLDPFERVDLLRRPLTLEEWAAYEWLTRELEELLGS